MAVSARLDPWGGAVSVDGIEVVSPGMSGVITSLTTSRRSVRAAGLSAPRLDRILADNEVETQAGLTVEGGPAAGVGGTGSTRATRHGDRPIELRVPAPGTGWGQMVLSKDEADVVTWHFARDEDHRPVTRGGGKRTYLIPQEAKGSAGRGAQTRGFLGWAGKKLIRVLVFKAAGKLVGKAAEAFAGRWEIKDGHRPYAIRGFAPVGYAKPTPPGVSLDWSTVQGGRALLIVHGTLTRAHTEFSKVPRDYVAALNQRYGNRVFAFDHPTLSRTPSENIDQFLAWLPDGADLDLDVMCISRGGLVTRELETRLPALSTGAKRVRIGRVVFIAAPNNGTVLADGEHWDDFIDIYTSALNLIPDNPVTDILDAIITLAKLVAVNALNGLTGLQAMHSSGPYLKALNSAPRGSASYFAVASNFEPGGSSGWSEYVQDIVLDKVFEEGNDLIVPSKGVFSPNGSASFPIADPMVFAPRDHISHSGYLRNGKVRKQILQWLA